MHPLAAVTATVVQPGRAGGLRHVDDWSVSNSGSVRIIVATGFVLAMVSAVAGVLCTWYNARYFHGLGESVFCCDVSTRSGDGLGTAAESIAPDHDDVYEVPLDWQGAVQRQVVLARRAWRGHWLYAWSDAFLAALALTPQRRLALEQWWYSSTVQAGTTVGLACARTL